MKKDKTREAPYTETEDGKIIYNKLNGKYLKDMHDILKSTSASTELVERYIYANKFTKEVHAKMNELLEHLNRARITALQLDEIGRDSD